MDNNDKAAPITPTHRHYKGGLYQVTGSAIHSETEEELTLYHSADGRLWARPAEMFHGHLEDGRKRFAEIDPGEETA